MTGQGTNAARRRFLAALAGGAGLAALPGCVTTNVATGRRSYTGLYSVEDDIALGRREHPKLLQAFGGEYGDARLQAYVTRAGDRLAENTDYRQFPYSFTLLNSPIVNAFALPGGFVYITRGLMALASNEAEMAGVLSHELGHVNARHTAERLSAVQLTQLGLLAGALGANALGLPADVAKFGQTVAALSIQAYSRQQEFEADMLGVRYMSRAGYDPEAMITFLSTLREQSIVEARSLGLPPGRVDQFNMMSTHPRTMDRVREATAAAAVQRPARPRIGREEYLARINGMLFGDDPKQGIVLGTRFAHPELRFEFIVPDGFRIHNDPEQVVARDKAGAAVVFDIAPAKAGLSMVSYVTNQWAPNARLWDLEAVTVNGLQAGTGRAEGTAQQRPVDVRLVAIRRNPASVYRFMFISPRERTARLRTPFQRTTYSFKSLSKDEAAAIRPLRLLVVPARAGDTVERLAQGLPYGALNDAWFRVLNDLKPDERLRPDQPLKVIAS